MVSACRSYDGDVETDKHQFIEGKEREKPEQHPIQACHLTIIYSTSEEKILHIIVISKFFPSYFKLFTKH